MHTHTIRTRYTFGDRVRFDSKRQGTSGIGTVTVITFDENGHVDYMIDVYRKAALQGGITEDEMMLLPPDGEKTPPR